MAFIKGFRAVNGLLTGEMFDFTTQDVSSLSWHLAPGWDSQTAGLCDIGSGYSTGQYGSDMGGPIMTPWEYNLDGWDPSKERLLAVFDVVDADYYKSELRLGIRGVFTQNSGGVINGNIGLYITVRRYTDPVTYTDTFLGGSGDIQLHRNDFAQINLRTCHAIFANVIYNSHHYVLIGACGTYDVDQQLGYLESFIYFDYNTFFTTYLHGEIPEEEFDPDMGPASEEGGYGPGDPSGGGAGGPAPTFDGTSDPWVDDPIKPGIAALGLVNLYKCDTSSLVNLGAELFPDIHWPTSLSDVGEVLAAVSDSIWNSKLIDYIVSAHIIPVDVTGGNLTDIKVGTRTMTGILARPITDDVIEFDCGTLHIDEYYTNFVDYLTRCRIYIPFHGFVEIKPEYWQSADLQLKYIFNVIDGSFVAKLYSTVYRHQKPFTSLIGQYTGCACVHVPMTGQSYASMFGGMIANAGGMAAGFASGNVGQAATSALNSVAMAGGGPGMDMSNPYNASAGFYGHATPYVIIERPVSHFPTRYGKEKGFPLLVSKTIGSCQGLTICSSPVINFACTDEEANEIRAALQEGVIV